MTITIPVAYACWTVYTPVQHITVSYTLSSELSKSGRTITITAHLEDNGNPVNNATVLFYSCDVNGNNGVYLGSAQTNTSGNASLQYILLSNGEYYFIEGYMVP